MKKHLLKLTALLAVCTTFSADRFLHLISFSKRTVSLFVLVLLVSSGGVMAQYPKTVTFSAVDSDFGTSHNNTEDKGGIRFTATQNAHPNGSWSNTAECFNTSNNRGLNLNGTDFYFGFSTLDPNEKITKIEIIFRGNETNSNVYNRVFGVYGYNMGAIYNSGGAEFNYNNVYSVTDGGWFVTQDIAGNSTTVNNCDARDVFTFTSEVHEIRLSKRLFWKEYDAGTILGQYAKFSDGENHGFACKALSPTSTCSSGGNTVIGAVILTVEPLVNCEAPDDVEISGRQTYFQNYNA